MVASNPASLSQLRWRHESFSPSFRSLDADAAVDGVDGVGPIDGLWYTVPRGGSCCSATQLLDPNALSQPMPIRISRDHLVRLGNAPATSFVSVPSGHHVVRVRTVTNESFSIETPAHRALVLVSNEFEIDVP